MSKRISKETRKRRKRNRERRYRRKMALRNQPRTTQEKADVAAQELCEEDYEGFSGSFSVDLSDQADAISYAFKALQTTCRKATIDLRKAADAMRDFGKLDTKA